MLQICKWPWSTPPQASGWPKLAVLDSTDRFYSTAPPHLFAFYAALHSSNNPSYVLLHEEAADDANHGEHGNRTLQKVEMIDAPVPPNPS